MVKSYKIYKKTLFLTSLGPFFPILGKMRIFPNSQAIFFHAEYLKKQSANSEKSVLQWTDD